MAKGNSKSGVSIGTAAAINVELGWVPTFVLLYNSDTTNILQAAYLGWVVPYSSGGTAEVSPGSIIKGNTSAARATVRQVLKTATTSWAAGDAAGFFILEEGSLTGTFGSETVVIQNLASGVLGTDDATVTANVLYNTAIAAAATATTGTAATSITRYEGAAASNSKGFTIGATLSATGKLLPWMAFRDDA